MRFGSAYILTNQKTGDTYVGITTQNVSARWREHKYKARGSYCKTWLHRAIRKYGEEHFEVQEIASATSREDLLALEMQLITDRKPTYNQSHGGEGTTGRKFTSETLAIRNAKLRGRVKSDAEKARISAGCRAAMTPQRREECVMRIAEARALVDETKRIEAVRAAARNRKWTPESRAKLSASCMGRRYAPDIIEKIRRLKMKPVVCTTNGVCYGTAKEAAEALGVGHRSVIRVLKGEYPHVKGLTFIYGG